MAREMEMNLANLDEAWLAERQAEIEAYRQFPAPSPHATPEEQQAYAQVAASLKEAEEALAIIKETLRQRQSEASRRRQQAIQWEVVRLRLRRSVGNQSDSRRKASTALMSRVLPSDRQLGTRLTDADATEQRRYLQNALDIFRKSTAYLPPEEALAEARGLLEYFSLLPQPRPQDSSAEHRNHHQLVEAARDLRGLVGGFERQLAMQTMASRAMQAAPVEGDES